MGGVGVPALGGGMGLVGLLVVLALNLLGGGGGGGGGGFGLPNLAPVQAPSGGGATAETIPADDDQAQFIAFVIDDVQNAWEQIFADAGRTYEPTEVILFREATQTGCGVGQSATGPFYCPRDRLVYLDETFFDELRSRFDAPGDFAQAYVIAHEVGHHVQTVLGISEQVQSREDGIKLELQADCFAGVWGNRAQAAGILERGDLEEGLTAAAAIGDDRIQEQTQGRVNPETWTHGSSEQRMEWFSVGFDSGDPDQCDTFS
jgi:predicted metalloprotease